MPSALTGLMEIDCERCSRIAVVHDRICRFLNSMLNSDHSARSARYSITCAVSSVTRPSVTISSMCGSSSTHREDHATPLCMVGQGGWPAMVQPSASSISFQRSSTSAAGSKHIHAQGRGTSGADCRVVVVDAVRINGGRIPPAPNM